MKVLPVNDVAVRRAAREIDDGEVLVHGGGGIKYRFAEGDDRPATRIAEPLPARSAVGVRQTGRDAVRPAGVLRRAVVDPERIVAPLNRVAHYTHSLDAGTEGAHLGIETLLGSVGRREVYLRFALAASRLVALVVRDGDSREDADDRDHTINSTKVKAF